MTEPGGCERGRNRREHRQRPADRRLADRQVRIVRPLPLLVGRHRDAHAQPQTRETEQRVDLVGAQRVRGVVAADDCGGRRQRIRLVQHGICHGDREVGHRHTVNHVAEVDEPHDALMACRRIVGAADERVVIVRIVVDRRSP